MEQEEKKTRKASSIKSVNTTKKAASSKEKATTKKSVEDKAPVATSKRGKPSKTTDLETKTTKNATKKTTTTKKVTPEKEIKATKKTVTTSKKTVPEKKDKVSKAKKNVADDLKEEKNKKKVVKTKTQEPKVEIAENEQLEKNNIESAELPNKKEENIKGKRYIDISVGAIICVVVIIALLVINVKLGKHAYGILTKKQETNSDVETKNNLSVTQEIGNVLHKNSEIVQGLKKKITFPSNVTASIYNTQGFNGNNIPNELKLILGWATSQEESKIVSTNENNQEVEAMETKEMSEAIKKILGSNMQYQDESFSNTGIKTFSMSSKNQNGINYANDLYTSTLSEETDELQPLIYQEIQKAVKYSQKIIVYVKTAFINADGNNYKVYKNFAEDKFREQLLRIKAEELFEENSLNTYTGEGTITLEQNSALDEIRKNLNGYKYIFTFDEVTQDYYLSEFSKDN